MERIVKKAKDGMVYTNGEIYGLEIWLAEGESEDGYYEIPIEEYNALMAEKSIEELVIYEEVSEENVEEVNNNEV